MLIVIIMDTIIKYYALYLDSKILKLQKSMRVLCLIITYLRNIHFHHLLLVFFYDAMAYLILSIGNLVFRGRNNDMISYQVILPFNEVNNLPYIPSNNDSYPFSNSLKNDTFASRISS